MKALARQHKEAIWSLHQTTNRLRSVLLEFYPQALQAFPNLKHKAALTILATASTPERGMKMTVNKNVALLHRCGRRNDPSLVQQIMSDLKTPALRLPAAVEAALGITVRGLLSILTAMHAAVEQLEEALTDEFEQHPLAPVLRSAPGLGPILAARVWAEVGDDDNRFSSAGGLRALAGTAPVTRASGRSRKISARRVRNKRLGDACHWWAFSTLTKSAGARAHYDRRRTAGDHHNAALRNLANKLIGRMWWCLHNNQLWDEESAWNTRASATAQLAA